MMHIKVAVGQFDTALSMHESETWEMADKRTEMERILGSGDHRRGGGLWIWIGVLLAVVVVGVWFLVPFGANSNQVAYETTTVETGTLVVTVSATGTIEPTHMVEISSELSGTIAEVQADFNDPVEIGQTLARLDSTKLTAQVEVQKAQVIVAEARVEQAQSNLNQAAENFESAETLKERGVASQQSFLSARTAYDNAIAALQIADADRNLADAQLEMQLTDLKKATLTSPIKGIVLSRDVDPGQIVATSLSAPVLFTIAEDLSQMELQVDVDEADIGRLSVGDTATFTVEAYDGRVFPAEISEVRFAPETVDGVVTYKAILSIDNSALLLRPGMTATAEVTVGEYQDVLLIPNAALRYAPPQIVVEDDSDGGGGLLGMLMPQRPEDDRGTVDRNTVWGLKDGAAVEIPIETGDTDGRITIIAGGALANGDLVITDQLDGQ